MEDTDILKQDVQEWIKIVLETEKDLHPGFDTTGELSKNNRLNDKSGKWFLAGSFGNEGQIFRDLAKYATIESNTDVLIIGVSTDSNTAEEFTREFSADELKTDARKIFNIHEQVDVLVDGELLNRSKGLQEVATDVIDVIFPENNVYKESGNARAGPAKVFCLAWAIEVKFEPGEHELVIISNHKANTELGVGIFNQNVKYRINVE